MSLLDQYEAQYATLVAEITQIVGRLQAQVTPAAERRELCSKIDAQILEAQDLLEQMSLEARELNATQRPSFISKLNCLQVELKRLTTEYRTAKDQRTSPLDLGGDADYYYDDASSAIGNDQRQRLLDNSERIERTGNRLSEGYRVAIETEELGAQVLNDLNHQRETLQGARARLRETNAELGRGSRTLNAMMMRALREKAVLYSVGVCFLVAVAVSLYLTFASSSSTA